MDEKTFNHFYREDAIKCLLKYAGTPPDFQKIDQILNRLNNDHKEVLSLALPPEAIEVIDDLICFDDNEGWGLWFAKYNPKNNSFIQAISTILRDIQEIKITLTVLSQSHLSGLDINPIYCSDVYKLKSDMVIAHGLVAKKIERVKIGSRGGNYPKELKGVIKALEKQIKNFEENGITGQTTRHGVVVPFSELVWRYFNKFTSDNPLCIDEYEIFVDGEEICQEENENTRRISKKTFLGYITKAKKNIQSKKGTE